MALLEVGVQYLVVVSVAPWIQVPGRYVATEDETCDHQTCCQESNSTPLFCPFYFEKLHSTLSPPSHSISSAMRAERLLLSSVTRCDAKWYYSDHDAEDSSSFLGDSSHSSAPGGAEPRPVGNDPRLPDGFLMCLCASRRNPNTLRLITNADTARTNIVAGEKLTSPPVPRKEETTIAEIMNVGTVTAPEKADDRAIFRRTIAR